MITAKEKLTEILCLYRSRYGLQILFSKKYIAINPLTSYSEIFLRHNYRELFNRDSRSIVLDRAVNYSAIGEKVYRRWRI